jgi:hypothetical protein
LAKTVIRFHTNPAPERSGPIRGATPAPPSPALDGEFLGSSVKVRLACARRNSKAWLKTSLRKYWRGSIALLARTSTEQADTENFHSGTSRGIQFEWIERGSSAGAEATPHWATHNLNSSRPFKRVLQPRHDQTETLHGTRDRSICRRGCSADKPGISLDAPVASVVERCVTHRNATRGLSGR